ncbi:hypothetical protein E2562_028303 [Oryza meyeriana var. granulata]|uniref:Uncharacterized protein n=1 Tax=Oryza meyeriana var. granulata TaxID=110450 RepID=A0A6G1E2U1_9ORYZ|nr:hypothetical protein E2562_028303 [Oryza meyeriana var. granulata]
MPFRRAWPLRRSPTPVLVDHELVDSKLDGELVVTTMLATSWCLVAIIDSTASRLYQTVQNYPLAVLHHVAH